MRLSFGILYPASARLSSRLFSAPWLMLQKPTQIIVHDVQKIYFTPQIIEKPPIAKTHEPPEKPKPPPDETEFDWGPKTAEPEPFGVSPPAGPKVDGPGRMESGIDHAPIPLVRLDPVYPRRAMERQIRS